MAPAVQTSADRLFQIFGRETSALMLPIAAEMDFRRAGLPEPPPWKREEDYEPPDPGYLRISGFVSKPELQKLNRNSIYVFVNQRLIRDRLVLHALTEAYRNILPPTSFPVVLLFLEMPPQEVDVNVRSGQDRGALPAAPVRARLPARHGACGAGAGETGCELRRSACRWTARSEFLLEPRCEPAAWGAEPPIATFAAVLRRRSPTPCRRTRLRPAFTGQERRRLREFCNRFSARAAFPQALADLPRIARWSSGRRLRSRWQHRSFRPRRGVSALAPRQFRSGIRIRMRSREPARSKRRRPPPRPMWPIR